MGIGYYGKKDGSKFAYCSAVKPGETGTFLAFTCGMFFVRKPLLWLVCAGLSGDFQNYNDRSWSFQEELIAVKFCVEPYTTEYQGKVKEYKPTAPELALLKIVEGDNLLTSGKMMATGTLNLGQGAVRPAERYLEFDNTTDLTGFAKTSAKHQLANFILEYSQNLDVFEPEIAGYTIQEANDFIESKVPGKGKNGGFKGKYKTWDERVDSTAKVLGCESDFQRIYEAVGRLDAATLMAVIELMKLS